MVAMIREDVLAEMKRELGNELHISGNEQRQRIVSSVFSNGFILDDVLDTYAVAFDRAKKLKKDLAFGSFQFRFHSDCRQLLPLFQKKTEVNNVQDCSAVLFFIVRCVFAVGQRIHSVLEDGDRETDRNVSAHNEPTSSSTTTSTSSTVTPQTETCLTSPVITQEGHPSRHRAVLTFGGGCLGEMWKKYKQRKIPGKRQIGTAAVNEAAALYKMTLDVRMSSSEKKDLPADLTMRDVNGGMFFPKPTLQPFVEKVLTLTEEHVNDDTLKKYGNNVLQVCTPLVRFDKVILEMANDLAADVFPTYSQHLQQMFFAEWTRKIVHARVNEYISAHVERETMAAGKRKKGGETLRDQLFTITSKKCRRSLRMEPT